MALFLFRRNNDKKRLQCGDSPMFAGHPSRWPEQREAHHENGWSDSERSDVA